MKKNKKDIDAMGSDSTSANVTFGIPKQMAIAAVCRGAQSGWPQLVNAISKLMENPEFRNSFPHSYASSEGLLIGQPRQLLGTLMVDPGWLTKSEPPKDVYAWSVWLTVRVYQAAREINVTLENLPILFSDAKESNPSEVGEMVRQVLNGEYGLAQTAGKVAGLADNLANHLQSFGCDLKAAQQTYEETGGTLEKRMLTNGSQNIIKSITAHADANAAKREIQHQLDAFEESAAKVTAFAVIANMASATQSLSEAWQVTKDKFESIAISKTENLGNMAFLQDSLKLNAAVKEWGDFSEVTQNFMKRALVVR